MSLIGTTLTLASNAVRYNLLDSLATGSIAGHLTPGLLNLHGATCRELVLTWNSGTIYVGDSQVSSTDHGKALTTTDRVLQLRSGSINCISLADIWLIPAGNEDKVDILVLPL